MSIQDLSIDDITGGSGFRETLRQPLDFFTFTTHPVPFQHPQLKE